MDFIWAISFHKFICLIEPHDKERKIALAHYPNLLGLVYLSNIWILYERKNHYENSKSLIAQSLAIFVGRRLALASGPFMVQKPSLSLPNIF
jgi:hypothetical protein